MMEVQSKICIKCKNDLPLTEFRKRGGENYLRTECRTCDNKLKRVRKRIKAKYGNPPEGYECPICERTELECSGEGSKRASAFVVDHCHVTDVFRGWLCHKCNRGIGAFGDGVEGLQKAINYLTKGDGDEKDQIQNLAQAGKTLARPLGRRRPYPVIERLWQRVRGLSLR